MCHPGPVFCSSQDQDAIQERMGTRSVLRAQGKTCDYCAFADGCRIQEGQWLKTREASE